MDASNRSVVAYIAGRLITGSDAWSIHDDDRGRRVHFEGSFQPGSVQVYSHELNGHVSGVGAEGKYTLFHHAMGGSVNLVVQVDERTFSGWEHASGFHFFGKLVDRTVRLYDFQDGKSHLYQL